MAGILKPSTVIGKEAKYTYLGGKTSLGHYNKDGSGLFNGILTQDGTNSEGAYYNKMTDPMEYVYVKTEDYCNIYAHVSFGNKIANESEYNYTNYTSSCTGKLRILRYDGTDYTIDVTDKYWVGRHFTYRTTTEISNGLTFEQFLSTELIDRRWQKIVANLPPGQYKFTPYDDSSERRDNEWFLEKKYSDRIKSAVLNTIKSHELIQSIVTAEIKED